MDLVGKLKEILGRELGITTEEELREAVRMMQGIDLGIFISPMGGDKNAKSA